MLNSRAQKSRRVNILGMFESRPPLLRFAPSTDSFLQTGEILSQNVFALPNNDDDNLSVQQHARLTAADRTPFQSYTLHIIFKRNDKRQHTNPNKLKGRECQRYVGLHIIIVMLLSSGQKTQMSKKVQSESWVVIG